MWTESLQTSQNSNRWKTVEQANRFDAREMEEGDWLIYLILPAYFTFPCLSVFLSLLSRALPLANQYEDSDQLIKLVGQVWHNNLKSLGPLHNSVDIPPGKNSYSRIDST